MIIVYPSYHVRHRPPNEIFNGNRDPHAEVPERIEHIKSSLQEVSGLRWVLPRRFPLSWIQRVHDPLYVDYLADAGREAGSAYVYPSVFPYQRDQYAKHPVGKRGQYSFDTYTPVSGTTYQAAHGSAMAALTAASFVRRGEQVSYALCRPPGHHAEYARMGGYCYFNNAAIAAEYLSTRGRVAVLDVDVHHGNGTQALLYNRSDVLFVSIHASPDNLFPYFSGRAEEMGAGQGAGYTVNYPLDRGTDDRAFDSALRQALNRVTQFQPEYLVLSLGYDTHRDDPIGIFSLTTAYFAQMAGRIAALGIPTVIVQEGGYNTATLGDNARTFVEGFLSGVE